MRATLILLLALAVPLTGFAARGTDLGEDSGLEHAKGDGLEVVVTVKFAVGSVALSARARAALAAAAGKLAADPKQRLELAGHTDDSGQERYNIELSELRARAVGKFLVGHGVGPERLSVVGYGFWSPLERNDTEAGRARNRRAEVKISP